MTKTRRAGMVAINDQLTAIAGCSATLHQLMQCFKTNATLRRAWRNARKSLVVAQPEQAVAWGNAVMNEGGGAKWGDGVKPAKAEEPTAKSEQPSEPIKKFGGSGSTWG